MAEFMTRLGLIPQLMGITLTLVDGRRRDHDYDDRELGDRQPFTQFTVTAQLRPYTQTPPTTTLETGVGQ